jgi:hypothetical protein
VTLPAIAPVATIAAPFTLAGTFTHDVPAGTPVTEMLSGAGTATVFLRPSGTDPNSWYIFRVVYVIGTTLPYPWASSDVGVVGQPGSAAYSGGSLVVEGAGTDIWKTADAFHLTSQVVDGDAEIVARVTAESGTDRFAKAGVMIRQDRDAASAHVILDVKPGGEVELMTRHAAGEDTVYVGGATPGFPAWLRLTHSGPLFTGAVSTDGLTWTEVGSTTAAVSGKANGGLAVTSHDTTALNQSVFDNVLVAAGSRLPRPWLTADVGAVGTTGYVSHANGRFTVSGGGADIWGTEDGFRYAYQQIAGDGAIVARVVNEQNTHEFAKAGVMIGAATPTSPRVILDVRPDGSLELMTRLAEGAPMSFIAGAAASFPVWLRLVRNGGDIAGQTSPDGLTWTTIGSVAVTLPDAVAAGIAVTSHDPDILNTATFDSITIVPAPLEPAEESETP